MRTRQKKPLEKCQRYELFTKRLSLFLETEAKKVLFNIVPNEITSDKLKRHKQKQNKEKNTAVANKQGL